MVRTLSEDVRRRLLRGAEEEFAASGYDGATMAAIAARAGVSTGNTYRYFANKEALFHAVVSDEFADTFLRLLSQRVGSLVEATDLTDLGERETRDAEALLAFWIEHRLRVVTILDRAGSTRFADFVDRFVAVLMEPTLSKLAPIAAQSGRDATLRFLLERIFRNTVQTIVAILESRTDEADIRRAFEGFWSYQLAGLAALGKWVTP